MTPTDKLFSLVERKYVVRDKTKSVLEEKTGKRLDSSLRSKINQVLVSAGLDGNGRFQSPGQGLNKAWEVLNKFGMEPGQHHLTFIAPSGTTRQDLRWTNPQDSFSPEDIPNSVLSFSWHKTSLGEYEIVAYLS